jgi:hypothetical protein
MLNSLENSIQLLRLALIVLALGVTGCQSVGPKLLPDDQFNYNAAVAESSQQQLLINLVRLRYSETPVFMKVSSVISQYTRAVSANVSAGANTGLGGDNTASIGGTGVWSDKPTITYLPVSGQEFSRNLLTPISTKSIFQMMQSGWPADLVVAVTMWSINDVTNEIARPSRRRQADRRLDQFFVVWSRLRTQGALDIRINVDNSDVILFLREDASEESLEDISRFRELLTLDESISEYRIIQALIPRNRDEIAVLTGSIWDIMLNLAWKFDVPQEHIASGRTSETFQSERTYGVPPIRLQYSKSKPDPKLSFASVQAHGYWFFIDERDRESKRTFSFLQLLLSLAETNMADQSPVVTISN